MKSMKYFRFSIESSDWMNLVIEIYKFWFWNVQFCTGWKSFSGISINDANRLWGSLSNPFVPRLSHPLIHGEQVHSPCFVSFWSIHEKKIKTFQIMHRSVVRKWKVNHFSWENNIEGFVGSWRGTSIVALGCFPLSKINRLAFKEVPMTCKFIGWYFTRWKFTNSIDLLRFLLNLFKIVLKSNWNSSFNNYSISNYKFGESENFHLVANMCKKTWPNSHTRSEPNSLIYV